VDLNELARRNPRLAAEIDAFLKDETPIESRR
jgi:hypothetical protein